MPAPSSPRWAGGRPAPPSVAPKEPPPLDAGEAVLATWHLLLDDGRLQDGEPYLAGTARTGEALVSAATAAESGVADGDKIIVTTEQGSLSLPVRIADLPDRVVWLPSNAAGRSVTRDLCATAGDIVKIGSAS